MPGTVVRILPDNLAAKPVVHSFDLARLGVMEKFPEKFLEGVFLAKVGNDGKSMVGEIWHIAIWWRRRRGNFSSAS